MSSNALPAFSRFLATLLSLLIAALFIGIYSKLASAANLNVNIDQAELVRLEKPGAEVIIGNPSIADVTVQSGRLLIVTGKSTGLTNLIVLDGNGELVMERNVYVSSDSKNLITVNRGKSHETYSCSPNCGPALIPGDAVTFFDPLSKETRAKLGLAQAAAEGTTAQQ
jgi:hypothetical protein